MGAVGQCLTASVFLIIALIFHVVGIATNFWTLTAQGHAGLWKFCSPSMCENLPKDFNTERVAAARGLQVTSLLFATIVIILCFVAGCKNAIGPKVNFLLAVVMNVTGMMCVVGACVYDISAQTETVGGYSLALTFVAGGLYLFVITPLLLVDPIKKLFDITKDDESQACPVHAHNAGFRGHI